VTFSNSLLLSDCRINGGLSKEKIASNAKVIAVVDFDTNGTIYSNLIL